MLRLSVMYWQDFTVLVIETEEHLNGRKYINLNEDFKP